MYFQDRFMGDSVKGDPSYPSTPNTKERQTMNTIQPSMIIYSITGGMILFNALRYLSFI
jgi:hypothetical protein